MSAPAQVLPFPTRRRGAQQWEPWLTEAIVAAHFNVSERTVRRWRGAGMPSRLMGSSRRFRLSEVEAWHSRGETS
jgi:hypothetical protein